MSILVGTFQELKCLKHLQGPGPADCYVQFRRVTFGEGSLRGSGRALNGEIVSVNAREHGVLRGRGSDIMLSRQ
jgi:hypothetical protein